MRYQSVVLVNAEFGGRNAFCVSGCTLKSAARSHLRVGYRNVAG
jgi:hypothetical protein